MRGGDIAGLLIRQARLQRDWSQEGLCRGICAPSYLSKIEQGKAAPSPEVTELLLHRLGLVWTPEPEGLAPCWKALLSGSPNFDSLYEQLVRAGVLTLLDDRDAPIHSLVDAEALRAGLLQNAGDYGKPWFGQLMAGPQMLAYLIQLNAWMLEFGLHL